MTNLISIDQLSEDKKIILLISNIERLKTKIKEENEKINLCIQILEQENRDYCVYMKDLEIEITIARNNLNLNPIENEKIEEILDTNIRDELKLLFRKISTKCHPDKTDDIELHNLFKEAKKSYSLSDYSELKKIYESVYNTEFESSTSKESQLEYLKKQLKHVEKNYDELTKKHTYIMTNLYNSDKTVDKMKSKKIFLDLLFAKIFELEDLKLNLNRG
jgi:hypothetical protein